MSTKEGAAFFKDVRSAGEPRYAETCVQYLLLTKGLLKRSDGINYICSPPLRDQDDATALWKGLEDGSVSTVGTDHSAYSLEEKKLGEQSFDKVPNGLPGMEFRLPLLFTEGVLKNRISINRLVAVTSTNVAKIFGLYPKKGTIAVGSDADIVIMDPSVEKTISSKGSLYGIDWSPYEGIKVKGNAAITISKGKVIFEAGEFKGKAGDGKFLERRISKEVLTKRFA
jgi:dihydropyrimidinase